MGAHSLFVPAVIAMAMAAIGVLGALRRFRFGHWAGLRTKATVSSPAAWEAAHRAGAPWMLAGGIGGLLVCAMLARVQTGALRDGATAIAMAFDGVLLVAATVSAQRAAAKVQRRSG